MRVSTEHNTHNMSKIRVSEVLLTCVWAILVAFHWGSRCAVTLGFWDVTEPGEVVDGEARRGKRVEVKSGVGRYTCNVCSMRKRRGCLPRRGRALLVLRGQLRS